jgi:hypothetical protein
VTDPKYAAFTALDPFFEISQQGFLRPAGRTRCVLLAIGHHHLRLPVFPFSLVLIERSLLIASPLGGNSKPLLAARA